MIQNIGNVQLVTEYTVWMKWKGNATEKCIKIKQERCNDGGQKYGGQNMS